LRREPEFFNEQELDLVYIGKRLSESQRVEAGLDEAGIDYAIEVDDYLGGFLFRRKRAGAFFYVLPEDFPRAAAAVQALGLAAFAPGE
jgi:hypothetical protein